MQVCRRNSRRGSRQRVGTARRRRPPRCGWCERCAPNWAPSRARCSGSPASSATAWSRCGPGCARPISTTDMPQGCPPRNPQRSQGSRAGEPRTQACQRDSEASGEFLRGGARPPTQEIVDFIDAHREEFGVEPICTVLRSAGVSVAPSTYYDAKSAAPSAAGPRDAVLGPALVSSGRTTTASTGPASCGKRHAGPATTWAAIRWPG